MTRTERATQGRNKARWIVPCVVTFVVIISLFVGRYPEPYWMPPRLLFEDSLARKLLLRLRLPRVATAFLMGMALSASGTVMQTLFRNPLASPGFLGVSQGAAFGAAFSIVFLGKSPIMLESSATFFAFCGLALSYLLAWGIHYGDWVLRLVLAGIVSSALFSSGVGVIKYMADPLSELPDIVFWLMGGLWAVTWRDLLYVLPVVVVSSFILYLVRWRLNLLALEDDTAFSLGVAPLLERTLVLVVSVAGTAVVVSVGGIVGWVGLIVPHIARKLVGADTARVLPAAMALGGAFMLICDDLARTLRAGEIPLGIVTSLLGALVFMLLFAGGGLRSESR